MFFLKKFVLICANKFIHNYYLIYKTLFAFFMHLAQTEFLIHNKIYNKETLNSLHTFSNYVVQLISLTGIYLAITDPALSDATNDDLKLIFEEQNNTIEKKSISILVTLMCALFVLNWIRELLIVKREKILEYNMPKCLRIMIEFITQRPL